MPMERLHIPWKKYVLVLIAYFVLVGFYLWVAGDTVYIQGSSTTALTAAGALPEITDGIVVKQTFTAQVDKIQSLTFPVATFGRSGNAMLHISVYKEDETEPIAYRYLDVSTLTNYQKVTIGFEQAIEDVAGKRLTLEITSPGAAAGNAASVCWGNSTNLGRGTVDADIQEEDRVFFNGEPAQGSLSYQVHGITYLWFGEHLLLMVLLGVLLLFVFFAVETFFRLHGKMTLVDRMIDAFRRYRFLIKQLVSRTFKRKYKRSVLGVFWSFLNPLLTMLVQYIVFSTIFKSNIPNFPVYLLSGIICFSFFSESTGAGMTSIVGNASLINKVYVPKYIYPLSSILASSINLLLSFIPLFIIVLIMGTPITRALLMLPYGVICLIMFCLGMSMLLSTCMVFFRDTSFLWGVVTTLWMYATPLFYPVSIIPQQFLSIYKMNPLYHFIGFIRTILLEGISPEPSKYFFCFIAGFVPLALGALVFWKNQNKFVLNI